MIRVILKTAKALCLLLVVSGFSGTPTCIGPVEFTNDLPRGEDIQYEEKLLGWWHAALYGKKPEADILLVAVAGGDQTFGVYWYFPALGICWTARIHATKVDQKIYYVAKRVRLADISCEDYTGDDETPGYIVFQAEIDDRDRLFLRFVRIGFFENMKGGEAIRFHESHVRKEKPIVNKYPIVEIESEHLADLVRTQSENGLFTKRFGPFYRIPHERSERISSIQPWRE